MPRGADHAEGRSPRRAHSQPSDRPAVQRTRGPGRRDLRRPGGDSDRERASLQRDPGEEPRPRGREPPQERVPREHVARAADAAERDHRVQRGHARAYVRRAQRAPGGVPQGHPLLGPPPPHAHQRHPRPLQDRGRQDGARARLLLAADRARERSDDDPRASLPSRDRAHPRARRGAPRRPDLGRERARTGQRVQLHTSSAMSGDGKLVLLVEDNEKNMKLARDILRFKGYRVTEATTGEDAVASAASDPPDLVLMDIQLPGIDGIEAFRRIRSDPKTAKVPVVALTASVMAGDRERFDKAGFDGFIAKPIDVKQFPDQVASYLAKGRA